MPAPARTVQQDLGPLPRARRGPFSRIIRSSAPRTLLPPGPHQPSSGYIPTTIRPIFPSTRRAANRARRIGRRVGGSDRSKPRHVTRPAVELVRKLEKGGQPIARRARVPRGSGARRRTARPLQAAGAAHLEGAGQSRLIVSVPLGGKIDRRACMFTLSTTLDRPTTKRSLASTSGSRSLGICIFAFCIVGGRRGNLQAKLAQTKQHGCCG